jgi:tetratricopeptide (TPR) repeat protein
MDTNDPGAPAAGEPQDAPGYVRRAQIRQAEGDYAGAVADCTEALRRDPQCIDAYLVRGNARRAQGYLDRALADYDRILQIRPNDTEPHFLRGEVHVGQGKMDLARQEYDKILEIDPQNVPAWNARAQVRAAQGDTDGAIADCNRVLDMDSRNAEAYLTRAAARWEKGELAAGLQDTEEAIRLDPSNASAYVLRGNLRESLEDHEGARADFDRALQLDPEMAEVLRAQGYEPGLPVPAAPPAPSVIEAAGEEETELGEAVPRRGYPSPGGTRYWVYPAVVHGVFAGGLYGILSEGVAATLALLLFTPLLLATLFRNYLTLRRAALAGIVIAVATVVICLTQEVPSKTKPFMAVTTGQPLQIVSWLLAWKVFGALLLVFGGATHLGLIVGYVKGGIARAALWGRGGALAGLLLGALLAGLYWIDLPGVYAGGVIGAVAGLLLGAAAGQNHLQALFLFLGAALGAVAGDVDLEGVYRVLGAGVSGGMYWTVAGVVVGIFTGASAGSKFPDRVTGGPLYSRLMPAIPLPKGQVFNLATGLLAAGGGIFLGASVGLVGGSILAGLAAAPTVTGPSFAEDGPAVRILGGLLLGALFALVFTSKRASQEQVEGGSGGSRAVPLSGLPLLAACAGGAALGGGMAILTVLFKQPLGELLYWVLAGAGMGGIIGAKLAALVEG